MENQENPFNNIPNKLYWPAQVWESFKKVKPKPETDPESRDERFITFCEKEITVLCGNEEKTIANISPSEVVQTVQDYYNICKFFYDILEAIGEIGERDLIALSIRIDKLHTGLESLESLKYVEDLNDTACEKLYDFALEIVVESTVDTLPGKKPQVLLAAAEASELIRDGREWSKGDAQVIDLLDDFEKKNTSPVEVVHVNGSMKSKVDLTKKAIQSVKENKKRIGLNISLITEGESLATFPESPEDIERRKDKVKEEVRDFFDAAREELFKYVGGDNKKKNTVDIKLSLRGLPTTWVLHTLADQSLELLKCICNFDIVEYRSMKEEADEDTKTESIFERVMDLFGVFSTDTSLEASYGKELVILKDTLSKLELDDLKRNEFADKLYVLICSHEKWPPGSLKDYGSKNEYETFLKLILNGFAVFLDQEWKSDNPGNAKVLLLLAYLLSGLSLNGLDSNKISDLKDGAEKLDNTLELILLKKSIAMRHLSMIAIKFFINICVETIKTCENARKELKEKGVKEISKVTPFVFILNDDKKLKEIKSGGFDMIKLLLDEITERYKIENKKGRPAELSDVFKDIVTKAWDRSDNTMMKDLLNALQGRDVNINHILKTVNRSKLLLTHTVKDVEMKEEDYVIHKGGSDGDISSTPWVSLVNKLAIEDNIKTHENAASSKGGFDKIINKVNEYLENGDELAKVMEKNKVPGSFEKGPLKNNILEQGGNRKGKLGLQPAVERLLKSALDHLMKGGS
tara:strand:- start:106 stop:2352 length:2247 start_codon:yes stop_codon:yes gene_type:complete